MSIEENKPDTGEESLGDYLGDEYSHFATGEPFELNHLSGNTYVFCTPARFEMRERWEASQNVIACVGARKKTLMVGGKVGKFRKPLHGSDLDTRYVEKYKHLLADGRIYGTHVWPMLELPGFEPTKSLFEEIQSRADKSTEISDSDHTLHENDARLAVLAEAALSTSSASNNLLAQASITTQEDAVALLGGPTVLGRAIVSEEDVVDAVAGGFPADVLNSLRENGLPPSALEQVIAPKRTLMRRKANKQRLTRPESDAAWRLAGAYGLACRVLDGRKSAIAWLSRPKEVLQGRTPLDLLETSVGTTYVNRLLRQLDWGDVA